MDNPGEIMRLCRLCLVKDQVNIPIFDEQGDIRQIFLKISSCLPVKVSREDPLPKSICDGCSNKLDLLYEFRNTSANAEKTLLSWVGQADAKDVDETVTAAAHQVAKPSETQVKQEEVEESNPAPVQDIESMDAQESATFDESSAKDEEEEEPPPPKRARRTAAVKAQINIAPDSDDEDDDDDDLDGAEPMTKIEDESEESDDDKDPSYQDVPGTSADDQPGPSGVGKDGVEAPKRKKRNNNYHQSTKQKENQDYPDDRSENSSKSESYFVLKKIEKVSFLCQNCYNTFPKEEELQKHIEEKACVNNFDVEGIVCPICTKAFKSNKYLRIHMKNLHEKPKPRFACCNNVYVNEEKYVNHKSKFHNERLDRLPDGLYLCKFCNKTFHAFQSITGHINTYHTKEIAYMCNVCGKKYYSLVVLRHHTRTHTQPEAMKIKIVFACPHCSREFSTSDSLQAHKTTSHTKHYDKLEDGRFKCKECERIFVARISIEDHVSMAHLQDKIFLCDHCGRSFFTQSSLKKHKISHITERNFQCAQCTKSFRIKAELTKHIKNVHHYVYGLVQDVTKNNACLKQHLSVRHIQENDEEKQVQTYSKGKQKDNNSECNIETVFIEETTTESTEDNDQPNVFELPKEFYEDQADGSDDGNEEDGITIYEFYDC